MELIHYILLTLSFSLKIFTLYFAVVAVFALLRRRSYPAAAPQTRFAVVIAARNEETVIGNLIYSLLNQDYPAELLDVYVVPNNCTDFTEAAAAAAGAKILHCLGPVSSKGDALHQAFAQLMPLDYDAFLVFDADNVLEPDYLARMNDAFASGAMVCKSQTRAGNPSASAVAGCYGLYNVCFELIWNRPRAACGLSAKLVGTGFGFRREVLERLGGWNTSTIAEDAEFAAQCAKAGIRVSWVPDAVNYDEEPTSFRVSLRQRYRWCSGVMQVAKQNVGKLWRSGVPRPMLRWDMTMFMLAPFTQAVSGLLLAASVAAGILNGSAAAAIAALCGLGLYCVGGMALGVVLCVLGGYALQGMTKSILFFPVFMASWLPLQIVSLFRDNTQWRQVTHQGQGALRSAKAR
ncbi:MAG: glycosyltransferase family 2 protein [Oscillospiraceae bacterium]|jgi:cellulose synthase/poly-beta-1,6-N-acetylglucosamine synthase-like glycosyltransferase|nr:glycosyltransferase family 2 protein [Oscillospiraceae bacterium]MCI9444616.1 glycosyltransferase family 2 protein [Oscillospiraceae bacterium]